MPLQELLQPPTAGASLLESAQTRKQPQLQEHEADLCALPAGNVPFVLRAGLGTSPWWNLLLAGWIPGCALWVVVS